MAYPAGRLREAGWDVRVPRLRGHGTCGEDFRRSGVADWRRQVIREWEEMASRYSELCVLGHSMGGLLALDLAVKRPVDRVALMAPLLGVRRPGMFLFKPLSLILERKPYPWKPDPAYRFFDDRDDDDNEFLGSEYWSWIWMRPLADLIRLQAKTEKRLNRITPPVLAIFGGEDHVIRKKGAGILKSRLKCAYRSVELPDCGHYIPYDPDEGSRISAMDEVISWFRS
jgi:carboxylesterase